MKMSPQAVRLAAAAVALAATLSIPPAAHAIDLPSPLAGVWGRLVRLVGAEGLGIDPNGFKGRVVTAGPGATTAAAGVPQATVAASHSRRR
jgi:hypothetical protein